MNREVVVTCAVTGSGDSVGKHPAIPVTPEQIAAAAIDAAQAGAAIAHIHVRDPQTGKAARRLELYREVVERVRTSGVDVIVNLTAGMGGDYVPDAAEPWRGAAGTDMASIDDRLVHVEELRPEICTLDCGSMNYASSAYVSTPDMLRAMAGRIKAAGVKPEMEVFELGHVWQAKMLVEEGLIEAPPLFQLCMGIPYGAEADPRAVLAMRDLLPAGAVFAAFGIGRMQMPMVAQAVLMGGHVRVGLEDNLWLDKGVHASNGDLVTRACEIVRLMGGRVLRPAEARAKLGVGRQMKASRRSVHEEILITEIRINSTEFGKISLAERQLALFFGYIANDIVSIRRLMLLSIPSCKILETRPQIYHEFYNQQAFALLRVLAGKTFEGWEALNKSVNGIRARKEYIDDIENAVPGALEKCGKYFRKIECH